MGERVDLTPEKIAGGLAVAGGALLVLGSVMPWLSMSAPLVGTLTKAGTDGDGKITLVVGLLAAGAGVLLLLRTVTFPLSSAAWALVVFVLVAGATAVVDYNDVQNRIDEARQQSQLIVGAVGAGLWIVIVGTLILAAATFVAFTGWTPSMGPKWSPPPPPLGE